MRMLDLLLISIFGGTGRSVPLYGANPLLGDEDRQLG